jgi:YopX protein
MKEIKTTGLYDVHGREIKEGDIVRGWIGNPTVQPTEVVGPVSFEEGCFVVFNMLLKDLIKASNTLSTSFQRLEVLNTNVNLTNRKY